MTNQPETLTVTPPGIPAVQDPALKDLVATAKAAGGFTTLQKAIGVAGMGSTLEGPGPYTVFAPNDAAFAALPAGSVDTLLKDVAQLSRTLSYHVVPGHFTLAELKAKADARGTTYLKTITGTSLAVKLTGTTLALGPDNAVKVIKPDVLAANGVIHVIDGVLSPAA